MNYFSLHFQLASSVWRALLLPFLFSFSPFLPFSLLNSILLIYAWPYVSSSSSSIFFLFLENTPSLKFTILGQRTVQIFNTFISSHTPSTPFSTFKLMYFTISLVFSFASSVSSVHDVVFVQLRRVARAARARGHGLGDFQQAAIEVRRFLT